MNNFGTLLKFQIKYKLGFRRIKETFLQSRTGKIAAAGAGLLFLIIIGCVFVPYVVMMYLLYGYFAQSGNLPGYLDTVFLLSNIITFIVAMLSSYSILFSGKDREFLTPLPIKKQHIFLTSYITLYAGSLVASAGFILPGIIIYEIKTGFSLLFLIKALIGMAAFPALPLSVAFLIMSGVLAAASGFRHKELFATIFGAVMVIGILYLNSNQQLLVSFVAKGAGFVSTAGKIFVNAFFLRNSLLTAGATSWVNLFLCIVCCAILVLLIYLYGGAVYDKIAQRMGSAARTRENKAMIYTSSSQTSAFFKKEVKTILRSPIYALNCLINIIMAPIVAIIGAKGDILQSALLPVLGDSGDTGFVIAMIVLALSFALMALNMVASTSISREGNCFWITQIVPVPLKAQIKGRLAAAVMFYVMSGGLFAVLYGILLKIDFLYILYGLVLTAAGSIPFACINISVDLAHPKLLWEREAEAVKQNFNGMIGMFLSLVLTIVYMIPFILHLAGLISPGVTIAAIPVMILLMIVLCISILNKKIKMMER